MARLNAVGVPEQERRKKSAGRRLRPAPSGRPWSSKALRFFVWLQIQHARPGVENILGRIVAKSAATTSGTDPSVVRKSVQYSIAFGAPAGDHLGQFGVALRALARIGGHCGAQRLPRGSGKLLVPQVAGCCWDVTECLRPPSMNLLHGRKCRQRKGRWSILWPQGGPGCWSTGGIHPLLHIGA